MSLDLAPLAPSPLACAAADVFSLAVSFSPVAAESTFEGLASSDATAGCAEVSAVGKDGLLGGDAVAATPFVWEVDSAVVPFAVADLVSSIGFSAPLTGASDLALTTASWTL